MKRSRVLLIALAVVGLSSLSWIGLAHAQSFQTGGSTNIAEGKTVNGSLYSAGQTVDVSGTVNGDVFCVGQSINISGTVNGDVLCAGQTVNISGTVSGSVRVAGQTVDVTGSIDHSLSVASQNLSVHSNAKIGGDVSIASATATFNGTAARDVSGVSGSVTIGGKIGRNLKLTVNNLTFTGDAAVAGNANYISNQTATVDSGAQVSHLTRTTPTNQPRQHRNNYFIFFNFAGFIYILLASLLMMFVLVLLLPGFFVEASREAHRHLGMSILTGILSGFVVLAMLIALTLTVIGIPLALLIFVSWLVILGFSLPVAAYYIGSMVLTKSRHQIPVALLGTLILVVLLVLPIVGIIVGLVAYWIGIGSILRTIRGHYRKPTYDMPQPEIVPAKVNSSKKKG